MELAHAATKSSSIIHFVEAIELLRKEQMYMTTVCVRICIYIIVRHGLGGFYVI